MLYYSLQLLGVASLALFSFIMCWIYGQFITTEARGALYGAVISSLIVILYFSGIEPIGFMFCIYGVMSIFALPYIIKLFV